MRLFYFCEPCSIGWLYPVEKNCQQCGKAPVVMGWMESLASNSPEKGSDNPSGSLPA